MGIGGLFLDYYILLLTNQVLPSKMNLASTSCSKEKTYKFSANIGSGSVKNGSVQLRLLVEALRSFIKEVSGSITKVGEELKKGMKRVNATD
ncbi:conserved hypothetical protein [Ricinus communis]|uniref:Uncharacterized protein n=1 Tax=Ricinus communis TaxID=3988 RepID=B9T774_RICCO|nr:conserved hypothetical protein [Ricinus communis]